MTPKSIVCQILLFVFLCVWQSSAYGADIYINDGGNITFSGSISSGDLRRLEVLYAEMMKKEHESNVIWLFSDGGDVKEALSIGRFLRKFELPVIVSVDGRCFSACIFLVAGSVDRILQGLIGVHRPNAFRDPAISAANHKTHKEYKKMYSSIRAYFQEMNIPPQLSDLMIGTNPEEIKILSLPDLKNYMLLGEDPAYEAMRTAREAKSYNLDISQYRWRRSEAEKACGPLFDGKNFAEMKICRTNIITGKF